MISEAREQRLLAIIAELEDKLEEEHSETVTLQVLLNGSIAENEVLAEKVADVEWDWDRNGYLQAHEDRWIAIRADREDEEDAVMISEKKIYVFTLAIRGEGWTQEQALENAVECFQTLRVAGQHDDAVIEIREVDDE